MSKLTYPKSPYLRTRLRTKQARYALNQQLTLQSVLSAEQKEASELEQIRPFKANPVKERILKGPVQSLKAHKMELTVPMSPAITKPKPAAPREPSPERIIRANPIPSLKPFEPVIAHRTIAPSDFELPGEAVRQKMRMEIDEKRALDEEQLKKAREFKANPLPADVPGALPAVEYRELTEPQPFKLRTEQRGALHQMTLQEKLEMEEHESMLKKNFVANPIPDFEPFVVKRSDKPVVVPEAFSLNTDVRAAERQEFEEMLKQKEQEQEAAKENQKRIQMVCECKLTRHRKKKRNWSKRFEKKLCIMLNQSRHLPMSKSNLRIENSPFLNLQCWGTSEKR